jgi:hypothetical protein
MLEFSSNLVFFCLCQTDTGSHDSFVGLIIKKEFRTFGNPAAGDWLILV